MVATMCSHRLDHVTGHIDGAGQVFQLAAQRVFARVGAGLHVSAWLACHDAEPGCGFDGEGAG